MAQQDFCVWCDSLVSLPDNYDPAKHVVVYTDKRCAIIQCLFEVHYSNKAILDREYMRELRSG